MGVADSQGGGRGSKAEVKVAEIRHFLRAAKIVIASFAKTPRPIEPFRRGDWRPESFTVFRSTTNDQRSNNP